MGSGARGHGLGTSTTTVVAFTAATARSPGSRASSSAASRVISDTTRCGPAWISTTAVSLSVSTPGDDPGEPVAGRLRRQGVGLVGVGLLAQVAGQVLAGHQPVPAAAARRLQPPLVAPAAHRVHAHAQQFGDLGRPVVRRHRSQPTTRNSQLSTDSVEPAGYAGFHELIGRRSDNRALRARGTMSSCLRTPCPWSPM